MDATLFIPALRPGLAGFLVLLTTTSGILAYGFLLWILQTEAALKAFLRTTIIAGLLLGIDLSHPLCLSLITSSVFATLYGRSELFVRRKVTV